GSGPARSAAGVQGPVSVGAYPGPGPRAHPEGAGALSIHRPPRRVHRLVQTRHLLMAANDPSLGRLPSVKREQKQIRAGVVGTGHMGQDHILVYAELWDVDLVGLVDVDASTVTRLAAQYDTQPFTDYRDLFGKVDVVSIAVPTPLHFPIAREFMEAGIHVLV